MCPCRLLHDSVSFWVPCFIHFPLTAVGLSFGVQHPSPALCAFAAAAPGARVCFLAAAAAAFVPIHLVASTFHIVLCCHAHCCRQAVCSANSCFCILCDKTSVRLISGCEALWMKHPGFQGCWACLFHRTLHGLPPIWHSGSAAPHKVGAGVASCLHSGQMSMVKGHRAACMRQCSPLAAAHMQASRWPSLWRVAYCRTNAD